MQAGVRLWIRLMRSVWCVRERSLMTLVIDEEASRGSMSEYVGRNAVLVNDRIFIHKFTLSFKFSIFVTIVNDY